MIFQSLTYKEILKLLFMLDEQKSCHTFQRSHAVCISNILNIFCGEQKARENLLLARWFRTKNNGGKWKTHITFAFHKHWLSCTIFSKYKTFQQCRYMTSAKLTLTSTLGKIVQYFADTFLCRDSTIFFRWVQLGPNISLGNSSLSFLILYLVSHL